MRTEWPRNKGICLIEAAPMQSQPVLSTTSWNDSMKQSGALWVEVHSLSRLNGNPRWVRRKRAEINGQEHVGHKAIKHDHNHSCIDCFLDIFTAVGTMIHFNKRTVLEVLMGLYIVQYIPSGSSCHRDTIWDTLAPGFDGYTLQRARSVRGRSPQLPGSVGNEVGMLMSDVATFGIIYSPPLKQGSMKSRDVLTQTFLLGG